MLDSDWPLDVGGWYVCHHCHYYVMGCNCSLSSSAALATALTLEEQSFVKKSVIGHFIAQAGLSWVLNSSRSK